MIPFLTIVFTFVVIFCVFFLGKSLPAFLLWRRWHAALDDKIPHLPFHWLLGSLKNVKCAQDFLHVHTSLINGGSKTFLFWLGPVRPIIGVTHPDTIRTILRTSLPKAKSGGGYELLKSWTGDGLLTTEGKKWERNRHLLTPAFHFDILHHYVKIYNEVARTLVNKFVKECERVKYIEVFKPVTLATLDTMLQCSLSFKDNIQEKGLSHPYVNAVERLSKLIMMRCMNMVYLYSNFIYGLTTNGREWKSLCHYTHTFSSQIIKARKEALTDAPDLLKKRHLDFLDILLSASDEDGNGLTDDEIRDEVDTFMFAGHDTTSSAISWSLYCLGKYPEVQEKVLQDVVAVTGEREEIEWEDFNKMKYLPLFIRECMRMYPPVPFISRQLTEDMEIDGVVVPKGVIIDITIYNMHHSPHVWSDPEEFRPERFELDTIAGRDPYCFVPFSAGPRNCIGQNFALNEIKVILSHVVRRFVVKVDPDRTPVPVAEIILRAMGGIHLSFTPRN